VPVEELCGGVEGPGGALVNIVKGGPLLQSARGQPQLMVPHHKLLLYYLLLLLLLGRWSEMDRLSRGGNEERGRLADVVVVIVLEDVAVHVRHKDGVHGVAAVALLKPGKKITILNLMSNNNDRNPNTLSGKSGSHPFTDKDADFTLEKPLLQIRIRKDLR
jgi:hypothetical protein